MKTEPVIRSKSVKRRPKIDPSVIPGARKSEMPDVLEPALATLVQVAPTGDNWLHEIKHDGYRMLCRLENGTARFFSRRKQDWTASFPALAEAVARLGVKTAWLDGEVIVMQPDGRASFQALQDALSRAAHQRMSYLLFDLLYLDGFDLRAVPLVDRKAMLEALIDGQAPKLRYSDHVRGQGPEFQANACKLQLEGVVSKRADSRYISGRDSGWLKVKCKLREEFVIGGYGASEVRELRGLLLGAYDSSGELRYVGRVGTGFSERTLKELRQRLDQLKRHKSPFADPLPADDRRGARWVRPELVAQVQFTEWTRDRKIRLPSFQGLRLDKPAHEIVLREVDTEDQQKLPVAPPSKRARKKTSDVVIAGVRLTDPDKLLSRESGYTKRDLALYYETVSEHILPNLRGRALTLVRCPYGLSRCFYQKSVHEEVPKVLDSVEFNERTTGDRVTYLVANELSALIALVEMDVVELHTWGSSADDLESPDRVTWDLDPAEGLGWEQVVEAAVALRALLSQLKLVAFVKTTGGKGLHVVVPIKPKLGWDEVKRFAKAVADLVARTFPDRFTTVMAKEKRASKIFIDYLRNVAGATTVAAYSPRAKSNAPVSVPVSWDELQGDDLRFDHFNIRNVSQRLKRLKRDPWVDYGRVQQEIRGEMVTLLGYSERTLAK